MKGTTLLYITLILGVLSCLILFLRYRKTNKGDPEAKRKLIEGLLIVAGFFVFLNILINPMVNHFLGNEPAAQEEANPFAKKSPVQDKKH
jgi:hypothetical protein